MTHPPEIKSRIKLLESELKVLRSEYAKQRRSERASRILIVLKALKKECQNPGFVLAKFIEENKFNYEFMNAFYKIGLIECIGKSKRPVYLWKVGNPTLWDAEIAIDYVNQWAKERRCLTK